MAAVLSRKPKGRDRPMGLQGEIVPAHLANLDALIPRDDFEVKDEDVQWDKTATLNIRDLEKGAFLYGALRKPDFQRETANWSAEKVYEFVRTFLTGDLIPALILWKSAKNVFVIDGAHRLSALVAWVHDDYGDGAASRELFQNLIPPEQQDAADRARKLINQKIGTYAEHVKSVMFPDQSKAEVLERARLLGSRAIQLQWVTGNAKKAEDSFFTINQEATSIDKTELRILKSRTRPNALAARAIIRSGTDTLTTVQLNEIERRVVAAEKRRGIVSLDARTARMLLDMATNSEFEDLDSGNTR